MSRLEWKICTEEEGPFWTAWCGHLVHIGDRYAQMYGPDRYGKDEMTGESVCESCAEFAIGISP